MTSSPHRNSRNACSRHRVLLAAMLSCGLAGCASNGLTPMDPIIPDTTVNVSPSVKIALEKIVYWGMYAAVAYLVLDPLAPNWDIEEAAFPDSHYHFSLKMKRVYAGGAGESRAVFHQRAKELMRQGGYNGYKVLEYTEGMESSVLGSQRVSHGVIRLTRNDS